MNLKTVIPTLWPGRRMTQKDFHRFYQAYPKECKAELIQGKVYMPSPLRRPHGTVHVKLNMVLGLYEAHTPGLELLDNATTILGEHSEPQPDLALRILPEYGGQSRENDEEYIEGAPEFIAEIAHSTLDVDLHQKKTDYRQSGVCEYLVVCLQEARLYWFHFPSGRMLRPSKEGIWHSRLFPGLWLDGAALLRRDATRLLAVIQQGLASREHEAFVAKLAGRKPKKKGDSA